MQKTIIENERLKKQNQELQQENLKLKEIIKKAEQLITDAFCYVISDAGQSVDNMSGALDLFKLINE
jgi:predicted ATP-grasp superfamily ATP-dependent carboligase